MKSQSQVSMNRRHRRSYLKHVGILEAKRNLKLKDWVQVCTRNQEEGLKRHTEYEETIRKSIESQLSQVEQRLRVSCNEMGFDKERTDAHINNWMESLKPWPNF
jgi:hypothetical protein